jgi:putative MATE family efflux protein
MTILLWGNVITHLYLGLNAILRSTGYPTKSMVVMLISVVVNCVLDPLFIFGFKWGIAGSAYATVIAQSTALIYELVHFANPKNFLHFRRSIFRLRKDITLKIISIGMAPFLVQSCASLVSMLNNNALKEYGGDLHIGAFSIVNRIALLFIMFVNGLNQGMQPIVGYNYGAKLYDRVLKTLRMGIFCGVAITTTGFLCAEFLPHVIAGFFADGSTPMGRELIDLAAHAMRIVMMAMPIVGFQIVASNFFQSIGKPRRAIALSVTRQVIFLVPLLIFMPRFFGIEGVWYCMPIADVASAILAAVLLVIQVRKLRQNPDSERAI